MSTIMITHLPQTAYLHSRWKNGQGSTEQIAIYPESADFARGDYDWRISSATIEQPADFSPFPDYDRLLVVLSKSRLGLRHGAAAEMMVLTRLNPYAFSGALRTRAEILTPGPVRDLGLLLRRDKVKGAMYPLSLASDQSAPLETKGDWNFLTVAEGTLELSLGSARASIPAGDSACLDSGAWRVSGPAEAVLVSVFRT